MAIEPELLPAVREPGDVATPPSLVSDNPGEVVEQFLARDPNTRAAYARDLMVFARFLAEHKAITGPEGETFDPRAATAAATFLLSRPQGHANQIALKYKSWLQAQAAPDGRRFSPDTIDRRLSALRSLVRIGRLLGRVSWSLDVKGVRRPGAAPKTRDVRGPGKDGVRALYLALDRRYQKAHALVSKHPHRREEARFQAMAVHRDRAILSLLYMMALRRFEVAGLCVGDVGIASKKLRVRRKGDHGEARIMTIPAKALEHLARWMRLLENKDPAAPLFVSLHHLQVGATHLAPRAVHWLIASLGKTAGLKTWPHGLRHAGITEALDLTNGDVRSVAKFSGHRSIQTVMTYDDERRDMQGNIANQVGEGL